MQLYADIRRAPRERCARAARGSRAVRPRVRHGRRSVRRACDSVWGSRSRCSPIRRILVLDEPSASLDAGEPANGSPTRLRAAAAEGRIVLVSTHAGQELLTPGDRRIVLEDGRSSRRSRRRGRRLRARGGRPRGSRCAARRARDRSVAPLVRKELTDALGNRWLIGYAAVLGAARPGGRERRASTAPRVSRCRRSAGRRRR